MMDAPAHTTQAPGQGHSPAGGARSPAALGSARRTGRKSLVVLVAMAILALGVGGGVLFVVTKPAPAKQPKEKVALPVDVVRVDVKDEPVRIAAQGTVRAARQVVIQPEITGRVVWVSPDLTPGGRVKLGQPLVRINARDYQLAVRQQQAQVASQQLALKVEGARRSVAEREWELYEAEKAERAASRAPSGSREPSAPTPATDGSRDAGTDDRANPLEDAGPLALRGPQVRSAEIALEAARSSLAQAELQLARTGLAAPFNGFVQAESAELGQLVGPSSQLATIVGTDVYWVQVSLPVEQLGFVDLPTGPRPGASAHVRMDVGDRRIERSGRIVRLLGDLDPVGRMARVLVEIDDPLGLERGEAADDEIPLLLGSYVEVEIEGRTLAGAAHIPTRALQPDDRVFVVGKEDKLEIRKVKVLLRTPDGAIVRGPLETGERLVVTALDTPVEGMALRVVSDGDGGAAGAASGASQGASVPSSQPAAPEPKAEVPPIPSSNAVPADAPQRGAGETP